MPCPPNPTCFGSHLCMKMLIASHMLGDDDLHFKASRKENSIPISCTHTIV